MAVCLRLQATALFAPHAELVAPRIIQDSHSKEAFTAMTHRYRYSAAQSIDETNSSFGVDEAAPVIGAGTLSAPNSAVAEPEAGERSAAFSGTNQIGANSNSLAGLSSVADKKVSSSLLLPDPTSQSTSATGNTGSPNAGSNSTPTLSVNAANPADVTFTVSGLESGYSGTVTFTDSANKSDVVSIGGNGTYSANLSNLTDGTLTYLMTVSNAAGNVINVDPTTTLGGYNDGSANAPAGTPQLPNLLNGYAVRPPWQVAGVDYAVGEPAGTTLQDWETLSIPGVTVEKNYVAITGNNITLNGIDFSLHGGAKVDIFGSNVTITNSNFVYGTAMAAVSASGIMGGTGSNVTLKYDTFNGNGAALGSSASGQSAILSKSWGGTNTIEYNYFYNFNQHVVEEEGSSSLVYKYNLIEDGGTGATGQHVNYLQMGDNNYPSLDVEFNTTYQSAIFNSGGEGFQLYPNGGGSTNGTLAYNTMIYGPDGTGTAHVSSAGGPFGTVTASVHDNYINKQNGGSYFYPDPNAGTLDKYSGDINLVTGALIDAPDAPTNSTPTTGPKLNSIMKSPSTGDLNAGKTVTLTLNLNEAVTVAGGTPTLTLNDGGTATYTGGSGTNALTFSYTVGAGQNTSSSRRHRRQSQLGDHH